MHTQLNCQSKQTHTKLIFIRKRAIPRGRGRPAQGDRCRGPFENKAAKRLAAGGTETSPRRRGPEHRSESGGSRGSRASSPLATHSSSAGESGHLPFSGVSAWAVSLALSPQARCLAPPSSCLLVAQREREGPWHCHRCPTYSGEPKAEAADSRGAAGASARPCHPFRRAPPVPGKKSFNRRLIIYPLPRNHLIDKSVPLKRT